MKPCGALVALAVLALCAMPVRDLDTWWHLATGRLILSAGIPRTDPFSFVLAGAPWITFEWLAQLVFWAAYASGGAAALVLLKAMVAAAAYVLAWRSAREHPAWSALLCGLAAAAARPWFVERPFIFDLLGVGLAAAAIGPRPSEGPGRRAWLLVPLAAVWANLHGAAALAAGGMALSAGLQARLRVPRTPLGRWALLAAAAGLAVLLNPHGWGVLVMAWRTVDYPGKELLKEWNPPWWELRGPCGLWVLAALAAAPAAWRRGSPWAAWTAAALAGGLSAQRGLPILLLCAPACVAAGFDPPGRRWWGGLGAGARLAAAAFAVAAAGGAAVAASPKGWAGVGLGVELPLGGAAAFLERERLDGRFFNEYESGGPLIFHYAGRRRVFIDGRNAEYPPDLFRRALAWHQPGAWAELDGAWDFRGAVVRRHPTGAWTTHTLDESPRWRLVYWDDEAMVYLKDTPANAPVIARRGYALLQPGRGNHQWVEDVLARPAGPAALLAELARSTAAAPGCVNARLLASYVLVRAGWPAEAEAEARAAVGLAEGQAQPLVSLAWVLEQRGDAASAADAYRRALAVLERRARPGLGADALNNLGRLAERRGDRTAAAALYRKALSWNPRQGDALTNLRRLEGI